MFVRLIFLLKMTQVSNSNNNVPSISSDNIQIPLTAVVDAFDVLCSPINDTSAVFGLKSTKLDFNPSVAVLPQSSSTFFNISLTIQSIIPKQYRPNRLFQGPIFQIGQLIGGDWTDYTEFYVTANSNGDIILQNIGQLVVSDLNDPEENIFYTPDLSVLVSKRVV